MRIPLSTFVFILCSCNERNFKQEKAADDFYINKEKFENIRTYINTNRDSICDIFIDKNTTTLKVKGDDFGKKKLVIKNFYFNNALKDSSSLLVVLKYAIKLNVTTIAGNDDFTVFSFNNNFSSCYSLYYRQNPYTEIDTACKVGQLFENGKYWIYLLDKNWYYKKESCL